MPYQVQAQASIEGDGFTVDLVMVGLNTKPLQNNLCYRSSIQ